MQQIMEWSLTISIDGSYKDGNVSYGVCYAIPDKSKEINSGGVISSHQLTASSFDS